MGTKGWYNGYSWNERAGILRKFERLKRTGDTKAIKYLLGRPPCEVCADPSPTKQWHSEDYSQPYCFEPPATFAVCNVCHSRIHRRFDEKSDWHLFLRHLNAGGFGKEFTALHSVAKRREWARNLTEGREVVLPQMKDRRIPLGDEWWQKLSLDPESMTAAWARPRP